MLKISLFPQNLEIREECPPYPDPKHHHLLAAAAAYADRRHHAIVHPSPLPPPHPPRFAASFTFNDLSTLSHPSFSPLQHKLLSFVVTLLVSLPQLALREAMFSCPRRSEIYGDFCRLTFWFEERKGKWNREREGEAW